MYAEAIAMAASSAKAKVMHFNTDAMLLLVDNGATACISYKTSNIISPLIPTNKKIKGFAGKLRGLYMGTTKWCINNDNGANHDFIIPNLYYIKNAPTRLLSPQHWAQEANDKEPEQNNTWCATYKE